MSPNFASNSGWREACTGKRRSRGCCGLTACLLILAALAGCGERAAAPPAARPTARQEQSPPLARSIELPQPDQRPGIAIVVLIDTSGSMAQSVRGHAGHQRPKNEIAREVLARIVDVTRDWHSRHSETPLYLGIVSFSGVTSNVLPAHPFDVAPTQAALGRIPAPAGGTAIGLALQEGFKALYGTGCFRKHLVCITDGDNTVATPPELMARQLYAQTKGEVELHFVAFDTSARHFGFLKEVNGTVEEAADGAQLQTHLVELYEHRILVEAMPAEKE
jgi:hypothetical protein